MLQRFKTLSLALLLSFAAGARTHWQVVDSGFVFTDPPFKACHAPTVVELANGDVLCAWFAGAHEGSGDVCIYTSTWHGGVWLAPQQVADGFVNDSLRYPCWNPVLHREKNKLYLFYKVGKSPSSWYGIYKISTDNGRTWSHAIDLPDDMLGPIKNKSVAAGNRVLHPSSTETEGNAQWKSFVEISDKKMKRWMKVSIDTASTYKVIQPTLLRWGKKRLQALLRSDSNEILQSWSSDNGRTWGRITSTQIRNPNSGIDAVDLADGTKLLVYNPTEKGENWWDGRNKLVLSETADGRMWTDVLTLENHNKGEFSYPAIIQLQNGLVWVVYTYDRKNVKFVVLEKTV